MPKNFKKYELNDLSKVIKNIFIHFFLNFLINLFFCLIKMTKNFKNIRCHDLKFGLSKVIEINISFFRFLKSFHYAHLLSFGIVFVKGSIENYRKLSILNLYTISKFLALFNYLVIYLIKNEEKYYKI